MIPFLILIWTLWTYPSNGFTLNPISPSTIVRQNIGTRLYQNHSSSSSNTKYHHTIDDHCDVQQRRDFLSTIIVNGLITAALSSSSSPTVAFAKDEDKNDQSKKQPNFTQEEIASFLRPIPTFAIVDEEGIPYMVVGEDAKLSAYFFTTYDEANRILNVASKSADKTLNELKNEENMKRKVNGLKPLNKDEIEDVVGINPWKEGRARISYLPLDFSVSLASRGKVAGSYFRIAPAEDDIQDALAVETSIDDLSEGKVPLFYIDDFEIPSTSSSGTKIPLYFQKSQLLQDYKKFSKNTAEIKVTELFSILGQMAGTNEVDEDLKKLVLVPPQGSLKDAKLCDKKQGSQSPYKIGQRIVVL